MELEVRRKKLRFRANHRGMQEADRLVGQFVRAHVEALDEAGLERLELLLNEADQDLLDWYLRRREPPEDLRDDPFFATFMAFRVEPIER